MRTGPKRASAALDPSDVGVGPADGGAAPAVPRPAAADGIPAGGPAKRQRAREAYFFHTAAFVKSGM